jgi:alkaline phosphatase D
MTSTGLSIHALFAAHGARAYGESVSQLAHALQCAALARAAGADDDLVLAALLHDVGHLAGGDGVASEPGMGAAGESPARHHGQHAARLIGPHVPERVAWVVEHHVPAKRYLCAVDADYVASLSPASVRSLEAQGGPFTQAECRAFERLRWFADAVAVRRWDDLAKDPAAVVPTLDAYEPLLARHFGRPPQGVSRRGFLAGAGAGALLGLTPLRRASAQARFASNPFTLGVASGHPLPDGVVLWTRLAPDPLQGGGMSEESVLVDWDVASDERFERTVRSGRARATAEHAHAVHVEVQGLEPDRWYWYRFRVGGEVSRTGRTRTAPAAGATPDRLRFAFASCQQYEQGYFTAYRHMVAEDLDLIVHVGDYIYESSWGRDHVRKHNGPEPMTLDDYRGRYALYRTDPDLQAAHAACPWLVTWDDHEVENDYADDRSENLDASAWFLARRAAAYQAYYEHMPLRRAAIPFGPHMRLFARVGYGGLVDFHVLDDRQHRSHQVCPAPGRGGARVVEDCAARLDPTLTLLGDVQERWLAASLERSRARWNVLAQQTLMAQLDRKPGAGHSFWTDGWDGYPAARRRLLDFLAAKKPANPLVIGGDVHSFWVADLKPDFDDPKSPVVATEFVGTSVTSQPGRSQADQEAIARKNPHIRYTDLTRRGYVTMELTPGQARAQLRAVENVKSREAPVSTQATFVVEDGRPGAQRG